MYLAKRNMTTFKQYYSLFVEFFDSIDNAVKHIDHLEENIINKGKQGVIEALNQIEASIKYFVDESEFKISLKFDGCIHPDTMLITKKGNMSIRDIIESNEVVEVLAHNHEQNKDCWVDAELPRVNDNNKHWVEVELENGDTLRCTEDHEIYTENRGYVPAKDLNVEDTLKFI